VSRESIVQEAAVSPLTAWENFYVVVGSSAGALTGLTFVVITLVAGTRLSGRSWGIGTFTTPTVVHFGIVLLVSAIISAPWPALGHAAVTLGLTGLGGLTYVAIVARRLRRRDGSYDPVVEDWLWHVAVPFVAYAALVVAAILLPGGPKGPLFGVAASVLVLLFVSIHNAWDTVTYIAIEANEHVGQQSAANEKQDPPA
jgi:hypothetical protein